MRRTSSCTDYNARQLSKVPKLREIISHGNLEHFSICKEDESKLNGERKICSEEKPLDFSKKPISSVSKDEFPENFDRFQIQDILCPDGQSTSKEQLSQSEHQLNNSITQRRTSPQPNFNHFAKEDMPPKSTSLSHSVPLPPSIFPVGEYKSSGKVSTNIRISFPPSHSVPLPLSRFPIGAYESSGKVSTNIRTAFPHSHSVPLPPSRFPIGAYESRGMISRNILIVHPNSTGEMPNYSRLCTYPQGDMLPALSGPMYANPYQQALQVDQDQQRQKKQRPFKNIDPSILIRNLPITQSATALDSGPSLLSVHYNSSTTNYTECSRSAVMSLTPQKLSADSPCIVNVSSCNYNESLPQQDDTSGEFDGKKIHRIPPEETDEKYRERRRKNNLAKKKYRAKRKKKGDLLTLSYEELLQRNGRLETANKTLTESLRVKEMRLNMVMCSLKGFREKCEGSTKELFEETFRSLLP
ncbi:hypothetical protein AVEN_38272-1 [Araneus ventricosus]|uniref:BZIP domain-containing protein n=1 Tax=Araneus ventricosus TaxID=182803 RepID=A0A4Y2E4K5_ARAVE|nr:hypothetical protein AVEN_38272-1 [Araneus ventricosus]